MHRICETHHQKFPDNNDDVNIALLQIRSTPIGRGLPSLAIFLSNRSIRALLSQKSRGPSSFNADDEQYDTLKKK